MRDNNRWHVRTILFDKEPERWDIMYQFATGFPARVDYKATNDYRDGNKDDIRAGKH